MVELETLNTKEIYLIYISEVNMARKSKFDSHAATPKQNQETTAFLDVVTSKKMDFSDVPLATQFKIIRRCARAMRWENLFYFLTHENYPLCSTAWQIVLPYFRTTYALQNPNNIKKLISYIRKNTNKATAYGVCILISVMGEECKNAFLEGLNSDVDGEPSNIFLSIADTGLLSPKFAPYLDDKFITEGFMEKLYASNPTPAYVEAFQKRYTALEKSRLNERADMPKPKPNYEGAI